MQDKNERTIDLPEMALEAVENVLISGEIDTLKESLTDFFLCWLESDEDIHHIDRQQRTFHYRVLMGMLSDLAAIDAARSIRQAQEPVLRQD